MAKNPRVLPVREDGGSSLPQSIRHRRRALQLSQQDVADLAGVGLRFLHDLERGKESVQLDKLLAVLDALGLHLALAPGASRTVEVGSWGER